MRYLVDTGVLLRLFDRSAPAHRVIRALLKALRQQGDSLATCPQNIAEFWNVSTRPTTARGGYGQTVEATQRRVEFIERLGTILPESPDAYTRWRHLVVAHRVEGVSVHDARLVAMMHVLEIQRIITLNARDFTRYEDVEAMVPNDEWLVLLGAAHLE